MTTGNAVFKAFEAYFYAILSVQNFVQRENLQELSYALQVFLMLGHCNFESASLCIRMKVYLLYRLG
jgi:hypothetical protein